MKSTFTSAPPAIKRALLAVTIALLAGIASLYAQGTCATATGLALGVPQAGSFASATASGSDVCNNGGAGGADLWYSFTATQAEHNVRVVEPGTPVSSVFASAYAGSCAALSVEQCAFQGFLVLTNLTPGSTYLVQLQLVSGAPASTAFDIVAEVPPAAPANDEAPSATALSLGGAPASGTLYGATDSGENACSPGANDEDDDVWYRFVAPQSGSVDVELSNLGGTDQLPLFSVLSIDQSSQTLVCEGESFDPSASFAGLTPGRLHYVQVYTLFEDPQTTSFEIEVRETAVAPANDDCGGATSLSVGAVGAGTVEGATASGVDPCATNAANDDVWFSFVATASDHEVYLTPTANAGSGLLMGVHEGTCGALANVGCTTSPNAPLALTSLTVGATYYVQVYSFGAAGGERIAFDIEVVEPPANDDCSSALSLPCSGATPVDYRGATAATSCVEAGVWYSFVGDGSVVTLTATPLSDIDLALEVYRGGCTGSDIACEDVGFAGDPETLTFFALADETYLVHVGASIFGVDKGRAMLSRTCSAPVVVAAASTSCTGASVNFTGSNRWRHVDIGGGIAASLFDREALGNVSVSIYGTSGAPRTASAPYANRNVTIVPDVQPSLPVQVRLYFAATEIDDLIAADPNVSSIADLAYTKTTGTSCSASFPGGAPQQQLPITASGQQGAGYYLQTSVAAFSEFFVSSASTVLPAELLDFSAFAKTGGHVVEWATASERAVDYFAVERSADGVSFERVGTVAAVGDSEQLREYQFVDAGYAADAYYRLVTVDLDGQRSSSELAFVEGEASTALRVEAYPNPVTDVLHVRSDRGTTCALYDLNGREVLSGRLAAGAAHLDVHALPAGAYVLRVEGPQGTRSQQVLVSGRR